MRDHELKPCPFCGNCDALLESFAVRKGYEAVVQCNGCLATMATITYDTEKEAIEDVEKAWNRRADNG